MAAAAGAIAVPVPVPIALSPSPGHAAGCIHAAVRAPSAPTLSPRCHRPGAGAPSHLSPSTRQWDGKKRKHCGWPQKSPGRCHAWTSGTARVGKPRNGAAGGVTVSPKLGDGGGDMRSPRVPSCPCSGRVPRLAGDAAERRRDRAWHFAVLPPHLPRSSSYFRLRQFGAFCSSRPRLGAGTQVAGGGLKDGAPRACPQPRVAATAPNPPQDHGEQGWELGRGLGQRGPCGLGCPHPAPAASPCPCATRAGDSSGDGDPGGSPARQHARPQLAASKLIFAREGPRCHQQFMRLLRCDYPSKTALPGNSASRALGKRLGRRSRFRSLFEVTQCPLLFSSPFPFAFLTLTWPEGWATGRER